MISPSEPGLEFADRVRQLEPEGAYAVLARAQALEAEGRQIIHLEIGQPDFETFAHISRAGIRAIADGHTRYNPPDGLPALRELIAAQAGKQRGTSFGLEQVVVGPGAKPGLFFPTLALVQPGDEVLYPDPGFPTYRAMIQVAGGIPVPVPLQEDNDFSFDLGAFDELVSDRTRLIILNTPANPTGGVIPEDDLIHIGKAAGSHDCWIMADEIYARLAYDGRRAPSICSLPGLEERTILVDGFSKTYAMTGWRLGFGIMPEILAERVSLLLTHSIGCTATFTQLAGAEALTADQAMVEAVIEEYQARRDRMVAGLNEIPGVTCRSPQGAFYAFPNIKALGLPSEVLARRLLDEARVAVLPGTDFGPNGQGYLRLCYATGLDQIDRAIEKIAGFVREIA